MQVFPIESLREKIGVVGERLTKEQEDLLKEVFPKLREILSNYYDSYFFKNLSTEYLMRIYGIGEFSEKEHKIPTIKLPNIEFAFSPFTYENFKLCVVGEWKKGERMLGKPAITERANFFNTNTDFHQYCKENTPISIYVGGIYEDSHRFEAEKTKSVLKYKPKFRPIVFDFDDKEDWRNTIPWTLIMTYYLSRIFGLTTYIMFFSGQNGIHLYPTKRTKLLHICERSTIREDFTDVIQKLQNYFPIIPEQFLIAKKILMLKDRLAESLITSKFWRGVDYEIFIDSKELDQVVNDPSTLFDNVENAAEEIKKYIPHFDTVVTKDLKRVIRLPASIHPTTFLTCDPFFINRVKVFEIITRDEE